MQNLITKRGNVWRKVAVFPTLICCFLFNSASARDIENLSFRHLYIEDGLSQSTILALYQSSDHYLWLGTIDGLNRYDGYTIKVFSNRDNDTSSLSDNYITCITEDKKGYLWIGTKNNGFNRYDSRLGIFKRFFPDKNKQKSPSGKKIQDICPDYDGTIWISYYEKGVDHFYPDRGSFVNLRHDEKDKYSLPANTTARIFLDKNNNLWFATSNGLARYDRKTGRFNAVSLGNSRNVNATTISQSKNGDIWVGTERGRLFRINNHTLKVKKYILPVKAPFCSIRKILFHPYTNQVIIGTFGFGLFLLDPESGTYTQIVHDLKEATSLSSNHILDMLIDKSNVLWIGTLKGVNQRDLKPGKFALFRLNKETKKTLKTSASPFDSFITTIYKDSLNNVWMGLYGNGLVSFNRQSGKIKQYVISSPNNTIWHIVPANGRYFWLASDKGLIRFDRKNAVSQKIVIPENLFAGNEQILVRYILREKRNILLLALGNGRLIRYLPEQNRFEPIANSPNTEIFEIFRDSRGMIWLGTDGKGLYSYEPAKKTIRPFSAGVDSLKWIQRVNAIREDSRGNLWVATSKGLAIIEPNKKKVRRLTTVDGLANNFIYGIEAGRDNEFWISSNRGLTSIKGTLKKGFIIRNFSVDDGLQSDEFNTNSSFRAEDGELFFGGINGLNYFYPGKIRQNTFQPAVAITRFEVMSVVQNFNPAGRVIELPYDRNYFRFEFAALDFTNPLKNRYKYILEGFDKEWIDAGNQRFAAYANLSPGQYTFRVKGTNNDGVWNEQETWVRLEIASPFWQTPLAYIIYICILLLSIFLFIRWYSQKLEKTNRLLEQRVEEKTKEVRESYRRLRESQEQLVESEKMRAIGTMASGIVHDFNNLLSIILGAVQLVIQKNRDGDLNKHLKHIQTAAIDGAKIIRKIQDFSRSSGEEATSVIDINEMLKNVVEMTRFKWISQKRMQGINIDFDLDLTRPVKIRANQSEMRLAFTNIIINAIESFTQSGKIYISTRIMENQWVEISVRDEGRGIDEQTINRIFEPFYSTKGSEGNGLGLTQVYGIVSRSNGSVDVKSQPQIGTEVLVRLPIISEEEQDTGKGKLETKKIKSEKRILIVEDELTIQEIYEGILKPQGYSLVLTETAEEGLEIFEKDAFDLIICDLGLPGMNGWEFISKIRQQNAHIPILVITGWETNDSKNRKKELNIQKILAKPVSVTDLIQNISAFLS